MGKNATYNLKVKMQSGENAFGQLIGPGNEPAPTVKALKDFGYDFIAIDLEHSLVNEETVYSYIRAARDEGVPILIRTQDKAAYFRRYLDAGVNGLVLPLVRTVEETAHAVDQSYFPPFGHRGCGIGMSPYLTDFQRLADVPLIALAEYINNNTMIFPQTERLETISNLPNILNLPGVTGTLVGPYDLAWDIGGIDPRALGSEVVTTKFMSEKLKQIGKMCKDAGKVAGIGGLPIEDYAGWAKEGYQVFILGYAIDGNVDELRQKIETVRASMS
jgi:2-keto-3-deoxy-L-rhamnonate aldolase RhmA